MVSFLDIPIDWPSTRRGETPPVWCEFKSKEMPVSVVGWRSNHLAIHCFLESTSNQIKAGHKNGCWHYHLCMAQKLWKTPWNWISAEQRKQDGNITYLLAGVAGFGLLGCLLMDCTSADPRLVSAGCRKRRPRLRTQQNVHIVHWLLATHMSHSDPAWYVRPI